MHVNICVSKLKPSKLYFMIADLNQGMAFQTEAQPRVSTLKQEDTLPVSVQVKLFFKWLNPRKWFSSLSEIDLDMSEFSCKKDALQSK